jgi:hypothetical protein
MSYFRLLERVYEKVKFVKLYEWHLVNAGNNILRIPLFLNHLMHLDGGKREEGKKLLISISNAVLRDKFKKSRLWEVLFKKGGADSTFLSRI